MHRLIVAEEARGMGLARKLIEFAVTQSPNGYLRADTDPKNTPMRALFERLGSRDAGLLTYHEFNDLQCVTYERWVHSVVRRQMSQHVQVHPARFGWM